MFADEYLTAYNHNNYRTHFIVDVSLFISNSAHGLLRCSIKRSKGSRFGMRIEFREEHKPPAHTMLWIQRPSSTERVEIGDYNPYCPLDSAIVAGHIVMEHYEKNGRHGTGNIRLSTWKSRNLQEWY